MQGSLASTRLQNSRSEIGHYWRELLGVIPTCVPVGTSFQRLSYTHAFFFQPPKSDSQRQRQHPLFLFAMSQTAIPKRNANGPTLTIKKPRSPSSIMATPATRPPNAHMQLQLISDIGPELVQRWTEAGVIQLEGGAIGHSLPRALLSVILRAASYAEADDFLCSYRNIARLQGVHANVLGFSVTDPAFVQTSVLHNLLGSASREEILLPAGQALSFYSSAGAGSGDTAEYHSATVDQRVEFYEHKDDLADVRLYALSLVVDVYAEAVKESKAGNLITDAINRFNTNSFVTPYVDTLAKNIDRMDNSMITALHNFYNAYYTKCNQMERNDFRSRLVRSVMQMAYERPANVLTFIQGIPNADLRCSVCRICLVQRFGIADSLEKRLSTRRVTQLYLRLECVDGRANKAVVALLAALITSWVASRSAAGNDDEFKTKPERLVERVDLLKRIRERNWFVFGGSHQDVLALKVALVVLSHHLLVVASRRNKL